jgi:hypothetical protein
MPAADLEAFGVGMIDRLLRALFRRRKPATETGEVALKNYALELAQEWGKDWLKPIQERLRRAYPKMSAEEQDRLNALAQDAMKAGHDLVYSMAETKGKDFPEAEWRSAYSARFPWVDEKNLRHLYSTGRYYAWKDGAG